jgi:phospholipid/cholesterol/gamma-HCH transport system permease protein
MLLIDLFAYVGRYTHFAAQSLAAAILAFRRPRDVLQQLYQVHVGALPVSIVGGLALGCIIWMHLHGVLVRFGPGNVQLLPQALALAVVLELGPIGAGLIVAGRSGASLGAELGSMRLTEQIDALEVLGSSPIRTLVGPRVLACMVALPLLTIKIICLAIAGGFLAEQLGGAMAWGEYRNSCLSGLRLEDVIPAVLKTVVFGYLIGMTGCYCGMTAQGGTEGVGRAATRGVVLSTFFVIISDVLLVRLIQLISPTGN